jgi:ATP-dependent DNA helicase RecQ
MHDLKGILKKYWGYDNFRGLQEEIITSVLENKDTLAILPTGGGKSVCFQVPSMAMDGICLVVTPLIALMKDQVQNLKAKGIAALSIYSGMNFSEVKRTLENARYGNFKFLYVSPERLESSLFLEYLPGLPINIIAVDEAHCVSQWGYDFRPPYLRIAAIREYFPEVPVLALTASATKEVQEDIIEKLEFREGYNRFQKSFERPNLSYSVFNVEAKQPKLLDILKNVKGCGIVYCRSRKKTQEIAELLRLNGIKADHYHAGLAGDIRNEKQEKWIKDEVRIIVCTNAFGMGIDKPDVRTVVHYDVPDALEYYYQEAGRAGRDEKRSYGVLLYNDTDLARLKEQAEQRFPAKEEVINVYRALVNYLQVPSESGEGIYYDFDLADFALKFQLDAYKVGYCLKTLEQEEIIAYSETVFLPSTIVFTTNKRDLEQFQESNPKSEPVIKGLLRSYGGVFDFPCQVNENHFARFIKKDVGETKAELHYLHKLGIINYEPQKDKPQIEFISNRVKVSDLRLNEGNIRKRKGAYFRRLEAMLEYTSNKTDCRSKVIANYFNDHEIKECGICDNCINAKSDELSKEEFEEIMDRIINTIAEKPVNSGDLLKLLNTYKKEKVWKVINYMHGEKKIRVNGEGLIMKGL